VTFKPEGNTSPDIKLLVGFELGRGTRLEREVKGHPPAADFLNRFETDPAESNKSFALAAA